MANFQATAIKTLKTRFLSNRKSTMSDESTSNSKSNTKWKKVAKTAAIVTAGGAAGVGCIALTPVVVGALGFTSAGIAAGSFGASLMSAAATSGFGGAVVATLQSVGAAGLSISTYLGAGAVGSAVGGAVASAIPSGNGDTKKQEKAEEEETSEAPDDKDVSEKSSELNRSAPDGEDSSLRVVDRLPSTESDSKLAAEGMAVDNTTPKELEEDREVEVPTTKVQAHI